MYVYISQKILLLKEVPCPRCAELQTVKDELREELLLFKAKAEDLEVKIEEVKLSRNTGKGALAFSCAFCDLSNAHTQPLNRTRGMASYSSLYSLPIIPYISSQCPGPFGLCM